MTSTDDVAGLCAELRDRKGRMGPTPGEMIDFMSGILPLIDRSVCLLESQANALREMEANFSAVAKWHSESSKENDELQSERDTLRARLKEAEAFANKIIEMNVQYAKDRYGDAAEAENMACVRAARAFLKGEK